MQERWAVAYSADETDRTKFVLARDRNGKIAVFDSQWQARKWVLAGVPLNQSVEDALFIRLPATDHSG